MITEVRIFIESLYHKTVKRVMSILKIHHHSLLQICLTISTREKIGLICSNLIGSL